MKKIGLYSILCLLINSDISANNPVLNPGLPFDTIALDDIVCLPETPRDNRQLATDFLCQIIDDLREATPQDARELIQTLLATKLDLFQEDIYCQTREINNRTLFKMPILRKHLPTTDWWELTVHTFYDQMHSPISSYFILDSQTLNDNLEEILPLFTTSTLDEFLELANAVEVTQRRSGLMFNFIKRYRDWFFGIRFPFYYLERNYDAPGEPEIPKSFIRAHLVNDKIGLGDTEFSFAYYFHDTEWATVVGGLELTLPTAITIHNGLYGSPYPNCGYRPPFDINTIIDNFFANKGDLCTTINQFNDLGFAVVDQLGALFLDKKLGANHHPAIALFIQPVVQMSDHWLFEGYGSIEYYIPKTERRFFITPRDLSGFDTRDFDNDDAAKDNLSFLSQQLLDALFFNNLEVQVFPGWVLELTGQVTLDYEAWQVHAGADFWLQTSEHFDDICVPRGIPRPTSSIIHRAERRQAEQVRVFGGFQYTLERNHTWIFGFHGDASVWNRNIGKGFSLVFSLTSYF